ncbi:MAG TPA: 1-deoxy-D-xylulose-5-phosphate reductoisomerase [Bauldia sp.]|nr:1-deoxy-D-xylulose-5-phosphate reductoisomerase [Bauldia sp.]
MVAARTAAAGRSSALAPRRVSVLGATGSIGTSTVAVLAERLGDFLVEAVTANANATQLAAVARKVGARVAVIADTGAYADLKAELAGTGIAAAAGPAAIVEAAGRPADVVVAAIVGAAGLAPTLAAVNGGARIALANKECLVSAGALFMSAAKRAGAAILPVDSEHNAIFQILDGRDRATVDRIVVTASGGPFRTWSRAQMERATPAEALRHPNWSMGPKITIDSATLMNKGLELIEAHHLFGQPPERLDVLIHPQSIVHGLVSFADGYILAALSAPDMRTPIAHCLAWPETSRGAGRRLDIGALSSLEFSPPDLDRFPALAIARDALAIGGAATNILSAANEIAVTAFLAGRIGFLEIARIVAETLAGAGELINRDPATIEEAVALDSAARRIAEDLVRSRVD